MANNVANVTHWILSAPHAHIELELERGPYKTRGAHIKIWKFINQPRAQIWLKKNGAERFFPNKRMRGEREGVPIWDDQPMLPSFWVRLGNVEIIPFIWNFDASDDPTIFTLPEPVEYDYLWGELACFILSKSGDLEKLVPNINPAFGFTFRNVAQRHGLDSRRP